MTPKLYVVSLSSATARRERMIARLMREDLPFVLVDAYEGTDPAVLDCAPAAKPGQEQNVVACLLSHLLALRLFLETPAAEAVVCEDDVRPRREFARHFQALGENVPADAPLVSLGYLVWRWDGFLWAGKDPSRNNLTVIGPDLWGTQMYLIRRAWAAECIARFGMAIDAIKTNQVRTSELITRESAGRGGLVAYPPLGIEDLTGSTIVPEAGTANHPEVINCWDSALYVP